MSTVFFFFNSKSTVSFSLDKYFIVHSEIREKQMNSAKFHFYPKAHKIEEGKFEMETCPIQLTRTAH